MRNEEERLNCGMASTESEDDDDLGSTDDDEDEGAIETSPWVGYDELARLLGEPVVEAVYPVQPVNRNYDFSWIMDRNSSADTSPSSSSVPVSPVSRDSKGSASGSASTTNSSDEQVDLPDVRLFTEDDPQQMASDSNSGRLFGVQVDEDIEAALANNRQCQQVIKDMLEAVQEELMTAAQLLWRAREFRQSHPFLLNTAKGLLDDPMVVLLRHADTLHLTARQKADLQRMQAEHATNVRFAKWTKEQRRQLARGIRQQNQKLMMDKVMETGGPLGVIQSELERIRGMAEDRQLEMNLDGIDYDKIARLFVPKKTGRQCELQWTLVDHPSINHDDTWSPQELKTLVELVADKSLSWTDIAARLGTNRPPFACLCQYQRHYEPHLNRGKWSSEEDDLLRKAVAKHGEGDWTRIACLVPNRTAHQCIHRWRNTLAPSIRGGRWTPEEDRLLREAVMSNPGSTWQAIAQHVPGRTDVKCRERWANVLDPSLLRSPFSPHEDRVLTEAVERLGAGRWAAIAALLPGRTDSQCRRRWRALSAMKEKMK